MHVPPLTDLIPHQDGMCLLERVLAWDDDSIELATGTHRRSDHPLRRAGRLRAIHLCEYGAQAMAVHGALLARQAGRRLTPGLLVALRAVALHRDFVEDLPGELSVSARRLHAAGGTLQYEFRVAHADSLLAAGRAMVMETVQSF
jgi:predicted hotdog family 3-hydroxylacyl-ACP dehydratase